MALREVNTGRHAPGPAVDTALERWIELFRGPLVGLLRARGLGRAEALELAQEAFAEAWCGIARFEAELEDDDAAARWLAGIARNLARSRSRTPAVRARSLEAGDESLAEETADEHPARAAFHAALAKLEPKQREAIWMHYLEETPVRRVAALLDVTEKTVEGRLYRGRIELRRILDAEVQS